MSVAEIPPKDRWGVGWSEYVRKVEFLDAALPKDDEPPVSVVRRVLFDGAPAPARIIPDAVTIDLSGYAGTVVTLHVDADDVQIGCIADDDSSSTPWLIGGRRVLVPVEPGWDWQPLDPSDPKCQIIVCSFYVAEVHVH